MLLNNISNGIEENKALFLLKIERKVTFFCLGSGDLVVVQFVPRSRPAAVVDVVADAAVMAAALS